jgi:pimeloyl-ACP methyl ester carboxylesterase/AraC-like DNA-binding protein
MRSRRGRRVQLLGGLKYVRVGEREPPAVNDPAVAKALAVIHSRFAEDLDLEFLAREAGVSRSVLGERFVDLLGESPMRYCGQWRMRVAADMLRDGKHSCAAVAYSVGFNSEAAFNRAFKREYGVPPITWKRRISEQSAPAPATRRGLEPEEPVVIEVLSQRTGACVSRDGTRIGYTEMGDGPPILMPAVWYHQVQYDWSSPVWRHWIGEAIAGRRLVRSDIRGSGLSDRHPRRWTFDALYEDFEAVADQLGYERFDVLAFSHSANIGLAYAARHPERVGKIIVVGGYARGYVARGDVLEIRRREALIEFARNYKSGDRGVFAQMLGSLYWPSARGETVDWFGERLTTIIDLDEEIMDVFRSADVSRELPSVRAATLVMHSKGDRIIAFGCSEEIAEAVPNTRLLPLDSDNHVLIGTEPAWLIARRELRAFLDSGPN